MPLHLDYRPERFADFVGSLTTVRSLRAKLDSDDCPHAFLLTGPSGCGKTTLARIIAHKLNAGDHNFTEMDSASFRGIDTIRTLRNNMLLAPVGNSDARVWLLDECHQLTKDSQEALLKALEDAPSHVYFILATTDPQKLKDTLKRRCAHYTVTPLKDDEILDYLQWVAEDQDKQVVEEAIDIILEQSAGSLGKALMLLDTIIDLPPDDQEDSVAEKAETEAVAIDLCRALMGASTKWKQIAQILTGLKANKEDPERIRRAVLGYCSTILLKGKNPQAYLVMDSFRDGFYDAPMAQLILACYEAMHS